MIFYQHITRDFEITTKHLKLKNVEAGAEVCTHARTHVFRASQL